MNMQTLPRPEEIEAAIRIGAGTPARRWTRRGLVALAILAVVAGGAWWYRASSAAASRVVYETEAAVRGPLVVTVTATGTIEPTTSVEVSSEMSGVLRNVHVDSNSLVKRGDVLAELDITRQTAELARARASLASAEAKLVNAEATAKQRELAFVRQETLGKKGYSAEQNLDTARADRDTALASVEAAKADIAVAKADVDLKQIDLDKSRILSPVDGIVLSRVAEPGQTVASSLQAPVLFTLAEDLKRMQVEAAIDEADIGAVKTGQDAAFTVDAYPGRQFPARIETLQFSPTATDGVVTYKGILVVDNSELLLRPGMTATAEIVTRRIGDALTVQNAALRYTPPERSEARSFSLLRLFMPRPPRMGRRGEPKTEPAAEERTLWVLREGRPHAVQVTPGASDGKRTEILKGELQPGDRVIVGSRRAGQ
ncbi:MAG: efflux RND transporter periplasmic adaptor subunit [Parvibaculaceae bacterium]